MKSFHLPIIAKKRFIGCHPPFGSISRGEELLLLISLIFTENGMSQMNSILESQWQYALILTDEDVFLLFLTCSLQQVSLQSCSFPKSFSSSSKTNLKSKLLIQANFLSTTPLVYHIVYFPTAPKILQISDLFHNEHSHSNPCLSLKWSVTTISSSALWSIFLAYQ